MQYFAQVTETVVTEVIVIADNDCNNLDFPASEPVGQTYIASLGLTGEWLQTSIDGSYRGVYAGIGYTYDAVKDQFVAPQPYASWSLDSNNDWQAPTPKPEGSFVWDEETLAWVAAPPVG